MAACTPAGAYDLASDAWVATDALGRTLPGSAECGPLQSGKYVGILYFLWLGQHGTTGPYDLTWILEQPSPKPWGPLTSFHHWGQAELGYYLSDDAYVIRKHAQMLAAAGVDTLIFDVTNGYPYTANYLQLCRVFTEIRSQGGPTPQITFLCPFGGSNLDPTVQSLYDNLYGPNLYSELWFRWAGKPLLLANPNLISNATVRSFFTCRRPQASYFVGPTAANQWGWLETYPQHLFNNEEMTVGVAQNCYGGELSQMSDARGAQGRSWHNGTRDLGPDAVNYGYNFQEQWQRALSTNPNFIFITGWNEWVAQRFDSGGSLPYYPGGIFWDVYSAEYSRDIEPMAGGYTDNYYYQMVANIRRYKGVRAPVSPGPARTITIDGSFSDWDNLTPEYRDNLGDTAVRNSRGWGNAGTYTNTTGRNDISLMKVAYDDDYIYFYVAAADPITAWTDSNWMLLFIDADCNGATGWQGYDYLINYPPLSATTTTLKISAGGWNWNQVGEIPYEVVGNQMELAVPRAYLSKHGLAALAFDFHWADNLQASNDITQFFLSGDSAPDRRFNYRYATATPGPSWEFIRAGDTEGWNAAHNITNLNAANGSLMGDVSGVDPYIVGPRYPDIDSNANRYIWIRMQANVAGNAEFFWGTSARPYAEAGREIAFTVNGDGQFHDYIVDMSGNSQWSGLVNTLRLDPPGWGSGHFEVDFIRVLMAPPPWLSDTSPPTGSIVINSGATSTVSSLVNLTLQATDLGSGVTAMRFSNDGLAWSDWAAYTTNQSWALSADCGAKTIQVQFQDAAGNLGNYSDSIDLMNPADLNRNCHVNGPDFAFFASQWGQADCVPPFFCSGCDLDQSGTVDLGDLGIFAQYWLWHQ